MTGTDASHPVIVHVMGWESQQYGSFERQLVVLGRHLARAGAELHLVFQRPVPSAAFVDDVRATIHVLPPARGPWDLGWVRRCAALLRRLGATHLHAHHGTDAYLAIAAARLAGVPHRFTTKHIRPGASRLTASRLRHRALAGQVDTFFAVSAHVAERLVDLGVPRDVVQVNLMGVDTDRYRPDPARRAAVRAELGVDGRTTLVVATSHLRPGKGVELLPQVAAELARDPGRCLVVVAGDGTLRAQVTARAAELGVGGDRFRLLGLCEDVPGLLAAADVFVLPTDGTEGLAASVVEALASGTPAVVTDVPGMRAVVGDVADVVPRGDVGALVAAVRRLVADPDAAARAGTAARTLVVDHLSVERGVEQLVEAYLPGRRAGGGGGG